MKKCICTDRFKCFECIKKEMEAYKKDIDEVKGFFDTRVIKLPLTPEQKRKQFKLVKGGLNDNN